MTTPQHNAQVNIAVAVNTANVRRETRHGREKIIVPSATLPDDVVMNGIRYPAAEIEKGFKTLEGAPAPVGHPRIDGAFVSARSNDGLALSYIGAHNENVRRENGRVYVDKVIDVQRARESEAGRAVLNAIEKGGPVHTSTGVLCRLDNNGDGPRIARDLYFDHDAILLNEPGAATPEQGVGMLVNGEQVEVVNSFLDHCEDEVDMAGMRLMRAARTKAEADAWRGLKDRILGAIGLGEPTPIENQETQDMDDKTRTVIDENFAALNTKVDGMADAIAAALAKTLEPVTNAVTQMAEAAQASEAAQREAVTNRLVKAGLRSEEECRALPLALLNAAAKGLDDGKGATGVGNSAGQGAKKDDFDGFDMNAALNDQKKETA